MREGTARVGSGQDPSALSLAHDAVIGRTSTGEITYWNRGAEETYGWPATEALGRITHELLRTPPAAVAAVDRSLAEQGDWEGELRHVRRDGSEVVVASRQVVRRDDERGLTSVLEINRDVTSVKEAEARLRESEERFRLMVESVQDYAIFMLDVDGFVVSWNAGAERIKGYTADEARGLHFSRFYPEEDVEAGKPDEGLRVAAAVGRLEAEGWRVRKDGSRFWAMVVITALRDASGVLRGFAKVTRDFTERRRYEERLAAQARLLDHLNDAVVATDDQLVLTGWNGGAERLYGWRADEVLGQRIDVLGTELAGTSRNEALAALDEGGQWRGEVVQRHKDGHKLQVEAATIVLHDGPTRIVSVNRDIAERRRSVVAEERGRIARELHDSVSQALFSLNLQARALQLALEREDRAPRTPVTEGIADILELTAGALAEMRALIFELRPGALAEEGLVAALGKHATALAAKEGLVVDVTAPNERLALEPAVEEHLYRLAQEALSNVVKHAGARRVEVRVVGSADHPAGLRLEICDDGAGFDPGERRPGHLGLATMAERAAACGGRLEVISVPGGGSTVRVSLPGGGSLAPA